MAAALPSESERRIPCWRCRQLNPPAFFCPHCEAIQLLPSNSDYLALFGFAGRPGIETDELQRRYYDLSRRLHPDRFQTGSPEEQRASVRAAALLNDAFRTLKDVESRGRWWLERAGDSLGRENNQVPPSLAAEVFEVQEKLADLRAASGLEREALQTETRGILETLAARLEGERAAVRSALADWPEATEAKQLGEARERLKQLLSELSYLRTLERDVRRALEE